MAAGVSQPSACRHRERRLAEIAEAHRRYCAKQLENDKTTRVLEAGFGKEFSDRYMRTVVRTRSLNCARPRACGACPNALGPMASGAPSIADVHNEPLLLAGVAQRGRRSAATCTALRHLRAPPPCLPSPTLPTWRTRYTWNRVQEVSQVLIRGN